MLFYFFISKVYIKYLLILLMILILVGIIECYLSKIVG